MDWLAEGFESQRPRLRAMAYRMLGSYADADDAVQEAWLRLAGRDPAAVHNLGGWLTTVVGRICLDQLRVRSARPERPLAHDDAQVEVADPEAIDPEQEAVLAESVGVALLMLLDTLTPPERLAFVLHDLFAVPFAQIAPIVGRTEDATKMLASRARRRVRGAAEPATDRARQRDVVGAFLAAARDGDFDALVALLDPDVVVHADIGPGGEPITVSGAADVAEQAMMFSALAPYARLALVDGTVGIMVSRHERVVTVMSFAVGRGRVIGLDVINDPERLRHLDVQPIDGRTD